jgi:aspartyl-tRNA(Asn)/glutamyl-tRNA(Gln) amidotransferase subunit A
VEVYNLTIQEAHERLIKRELSSVELTRSVLDRLAMVEDKVNAFLTITPELALAQAEQADSRLAAGNAGPLTGIPVAIKDVLCTKGVRTSCGSRILESFVPPYSATAVARLEEAGAVMVGKTNMDEFAMGSSTENSAFAPSRNPWDTTRVPGGSSGGSAVAVSAGEALCALGSDTGGSVRLPASFCSVVGLKPSYGRVSRYGVIAFASSLDQVGPFARTVNDCALVFQTIAGYDPRESTSMNLPVPDIASSLSRVHDLRGKRIGVPKEYFVKGMDAKVEATVRAAIKKLEDLGATLDEVSLPHTTYALPVYYLIAPAEASANLARYDGVKYGLSAPDASSVLENYGLTRGRGFGPEVKRRIMLGTYALSAGYYDAYYLKAQKVRTLIKADFDQAFEHFDALVAPVSPTVAFKIGEKVADPLTMYLSDIFTLGPSLAGIPGVSVPCGFVDNMPVGLQILGRAFDEATVLTVAHAYEQATEWHTMQPVL